MTSRFLAVLPVLLASSTACTTSLTTGQTARALKPGQVEVGVTGSVPISSEFVGELSDLAKASANRLKDAQNADRPLTEAEQREALEAGLALVLFHPALVTEITGRIGVFPRFDFGLKYAGTMLKLDGKYQLRSGEDGGPDLAIAIGGTRHFGYGASVLKPAYELLSFVQLDDYSRHDLDVAFLASSEWDEMIALYGGLKYMISFMSIDADIQNVETANDLPRTELSSTFHYAGLSGGLRLGYKHVFATLELNVMRVFATPVVFGEERDLGGFIVSPSFGLLAKF